MTEKTVSKTSDLPARFRTAVIAGIPTVILILLPSPFFVGLLAMALVFIGIFEYDGMFTHNQIQMSLLALLGGSFLMSAATILGGQVGLTAALFFVCFGLFLHFLIVYPVESIIKFGPLGISLFGIIWIAWSLNHFTLIKGLPEGTSLVIWLLLIIWVSDTAAYFGGRTFGRTPLAPAISPKKTFEGSICGAVGAGVVSVLMCIYFLSSIHWFWALTIGIVIAIIGQIGDLIESKLKRLCHVKDSGTIFPGHGGVLDRVDGFLTAAPAFYYVMYVSL